jgi:cation diffusion facilitator family transporter
MKTNETKRPLEHSLGETEAASDAGCGCNLDQASILERKTLLILLLINGFMFVAEALAGWWGESIGLLADSLDMFADASVYGVALYAVGRSARLKLNAAKASGVIQISLGLGVLVEVTRKFFYGSEPVSELMMAFGVIALIANVSCLLLLAKHRQGGIHMRASWIFSTNDVIANLGVIISGGLVMYFHSRIPDLIIGTIISGFVLRGGIQILREAKAILAKEGNA